MVRVLLVLVCSILLFACNPTSDERVLPTRIDLENSLTPAQDNTGPEAPASENAETNSTGQLQFWEAVSGGIEDAARTDVWTFIGQVGENINLRAIAQGFQVEIVLHAPTGEVLRRGDNILLQLSETGIYEVEITSADGNAGSYDLGLSYSDRPNPSLASGETLPEVVGVPTPLPLNTNLGTFITEITDSQTVAGTFTNPNDSHVYTFNGQAGEFFNLEMTRVSGELRPFIRLLTAEGRSLAVDNGSGGQDKAVIRNVMLPQDELYLIQVTSNRDVGSYALFADVNTDYVAATPATRFTPVATLVPPVMTPTFTPYETGALMQRGVPYRGRIRDGDGFLPFYFSAEAGEVVTLGVTPDADNALIPKIEIIDPNGIPISVVSGLSSPGDRKAVIRSLVLAETGSYTVLVTSEGDTTGRFVVSLGSGTTNETVMIGEALLDRTNEGDLLASNIQYVWHAYLMQGAVVTASIEPLDNRVDAILELVSDQGVLVGITRDNSGNRKPQIVGVEIPSTGYYNFRVRSVSENTLGKYGLVWRYVTIAPTATPLEGASSLVTIQDRVADRSYAFYPFQGYEGQVIQVKVDSTSDGFDPVAALLDGDANILIEIDDTGGNLNPQFTYTLPADGIYNIRVNGYQQGGAFNLLVEELF